MLACLWGHRKDMHIVVHIHDSPRRRYTVNLIKKKIIERLVRKKRKSESPGAEDCPHSGADWTHASTGLFCFGLTLSLPFSNEGTACISSSPTLLSHFSFLTAILFSYLFCCFLWHTPIYPASISFNLVSRSRASVTILSAFSFSFFQGLHLYINSTYLLTGICASAF